MMRRIRRYLIGGVSGLLGVLYTPMYGQIAVAVVTDVPETLTNIRRYQQYVLQAQQFLEEARYWMENGQQLYQVIDRLGSSGSFWKKVDATLDGISLAGKVSADQEWGSEWYPDEYLRMVRESNRFGQALADVGQVTGDRDLERVLGRSSYVLASTVAYVDSMHKILQDLGRQNEQMEHTVRDILNEPVSAEEGVAGLLEKEQGLQAMGLAGQGMTHSLLRTMLQAQVEQFAQTQLDRVTDWEYEQASSLNQIRRQYMKRHAALEWYRERAEQEMEREKTRYASDRDTLPVVPRFQIYQ